MPSKSCNCFSIDGMIGADLLRLELARPYRGPLRWQQEHYKPDAPQTLVQECHSFFYHDAGQISCLLIVVYMARLKITGVMLSHLDQTPTKSRNI